MRKIRTLAAALALAALGSMGSAHAQTSFGPSDAKETYYWISQNSTLPLFVRSDYRGLERIAEELGVQVRIAGPTNIDLAAFIAAIDQVCAQQPAGVSVVGWDPSLAASVDNCIKLKVPRRPNLTESQSARLGIRSLREGDSLPIHIGG